MTFREVDGEWRRVDSREPKPPTLADILQKLNMNAKQRNLALNFISRYTIFVNGKPIKRNIIGWKTAYAEARKRLNPIFEPNNIIEILNLWTAEIITLEEATKRINKLKAKRLNESVNSGTT